ncbi:MAG: hypothetical protein KGI80_01430 [Verrucomicrobiota bacterium]|nr:hypothetical protein [Verrucomicrobiota bacterium]
MQIPWNKLEKKENVTAFALVACTKPSSSGEMQVELHYEGDEDLVGLILEQATLILQEKVAEKKEG